MKIFKCNIWDFIGKVDAICITTNGYVKTAGACVMGRGCAREAMDRFEGIDFKLGRSIREKGNIPAIIWDNPTIVSFPVKPQNEPCINPSEQIVKHMIDKFHEGMLIPGWACKAKLNIIKASAAYLAELAKDHKWAKVVLPMVGCGAGELLWKDVEPVLDELLDPTIFFCVSK